MARTLCEMGHRADDTPKADKPRDECSVMPLRRGDGPRHSPKRLQCDRFHRRRGGGVTQISQGMGSTRPSPIHRSDFKRMSLN